MSYRVGNLEIQVASSAETAVANLDAILSRLTSIKRTVNSTIAAAGGISNIGGGASSAIGAGSGGSGSGGARKKASSTDRAIGLASTIGKWAYMINMSKVYGRSLANIVQKGIDYTETLNLWQTAMRGNVAEARTFVAEMNKAYGLAEATLMKYQATFKNMLSALGSIAEGTAYNLSESLTQMAIDFSSLYNVSIEDAMTKFQAVLSGQVRPIRSISGYDITENTIFSMYQELGGSKTMRQLDQTEKRLLRIYAVFQQMGDTGALGDLQKTLKTNSNQLRMMNEQAKEFATWIGNGISYLIQESEILIKLNGLLIAMKEIAKSIAYSMGYKEDNFISGIFDGAQEAENEIEELQGKLLGFDKFQVMQDTGSGQSTDVESIVAAALEAYQSLYKGIDNPAVGEANSILEKFGFTLETVTDEETGATTQVWKFNHGTSELGDSILLVTTLLGSFGAVLGATLIIDKIKDIGKLASAFSKLKGAITPTTIVIALIIAALAYMYTTNEDFRESINNLVKVLFTLVGSLLEPIIDLINIILPLVTTVLDVLAKMLTPIINIVSEIISILDKTGLLQAFLAIVIGGIIAINVAMSANPIGAFIISVVALGVAIGIVVKKIVENWQTIWTSLKKVFRNVGNFFVNIGVGIAEFFVGIVNMLVDMVNAFLSPIDAIAEAFGGNVEIPHWNPNLKQYYNIIPEFANGGTPEKGSMFIAGEAGAELVTNMSGGQTGVMNMEQLQAAVARGMLIAMANSDSGDDNGNDINLFIDGQVLFNITRKAALRNGYDLVKVR